MIFKFFEKWLRHGHYKCFLKYKKHLKRPAAFAKNVYGGLNFSTKFKAKG